MEDDGGAVRGRRDIGREHRVARDPMDAGGFLHRGKPIRVAVEPTDPPAACKQPARDFSANAAGCAENESRLICHDFSPSYCDVPKMENSSVKRNCRKSCSIYTEMDERTRLEPLPQLFGRSSGAIAVGCGPLAKPHAAH